MGTPSCAKAALPRKLAATARRTGTLHVLAINRVAYLLVFIFLGWFFLRSVWYLSLHHLQRGTFMKLRSVLSLLTLLVCVVAGGSTNLRAQGTDLGTIRGTVTDSAGARLPKAQ